MPTRPGAPAPVRGVKPGAPPARPQVELVGKPIRRDTNAPTGGNRPAPPTRPGMPGMRKPVAPGELMQLQKPGARPAAPPPRRPGAPTAPAGAGAPGSTDAARPTATPPTAPRRPNFRAPQPPAGGRPRRPDWDDSAKLEALRSRSPQKQRQKVHIIGENDDALTAETGGYAGEQEAQVLQASLARPAKPKSTATPQRKPTAVTRKRKKETTRQRQRRRAMELRAAREAKQQRPEMLIVPEGNLTVQELADRLGVDSSEIIKSLFFKGIIATVTQTLDLSAIENVSDEFGVPVLEDDVEAAAAKTVEMIEESDLAHLIRRPPVVTVMGHVDHGKTSLLDSIRKTRVTAGEAGGITQHIGAYQVTRNGRAITFIDTPGHEAFTAMRARGAQVTDVAILVVAADDGVKPQTAEAINHAKAAKVPIVVAINKCDLPAADPIRARAQLTEYGLVAEDLGGDVPMVEVSAMAKTGLDDLLEIVLLQADMLELRSNPEKQARGRVIEANLDRGRGPVATLLVQAGTLRRGDILVAGTADGRIRAMFDENGAPVEEAGPARPVQVLGLDEVPEAGDEFRVVDAERFARDVAERRSARERRKELADRRPTTLEEFTSAVEAGDRATLNVIIKADVSGSAEALEDALLKLELEEVQVRVIQKGVGAISQGDVRLAEASNAIIVAFNVRPGTNVREEIARTGVDVRTYRIIYEAIEDIELSVRGLLAPEQREQTLGEAEVREIFRVPRIGVVSGCMVTQGVVRREAKVRVVRDGVVLVEDTMSSLRRFKDDAKEVAQGFECGIGLEKFQDVKVGDVIEAFEIIEVART